jgi:hypothetical protein
MSTYTNPLSRHQSIEVKPSPDGQETQLYAPGNVGLTLVLLVQENNGEQRCTYCEDAIEVIRLINIRECEIAHYDMTALSYDQRTAIHNAEHLYAKDLRVLTKRDAGRRGVYETPAFVLFYDANPVAMLVGWLKDDEEPHSRLLLENLNRVQAFFTRSIDELKGVGAHELDEPFVTRGALDMQPANDIDPVDEFEHHQSEVTGATYNVYWEKAAGTP